MNGEVQTGTQIDLRRGLVSLAQQFCKRVRGGEKAWNEGLGEVVKAAINESDLPASTTPVEIARKLGILPPVRKVKA